VDKNENIMMLKRMLEIVSNTTMVVRILLVLIPAEFDFNPGMVASLSTETWKR
jgi:hypothetical protein